MPIPTPAPRTPRARVLLVTHHFSPENVAPARRWDALIGRMTQEGFEFGVLAPPPHEDADPGPPEGRHAVRVGAHGELIVRTAYRRHSRRLVSRAWDQAVAAASAVPRGLRHFRRPERRPDVVIGTVPGIPSMFAAWTLARLLGARFVVEMRDAWPDLIGPSTMLGELSRLGVRRALRSGVTRLAHRTISRLQAHADLVVTTTETFADVLRERGQRRVEVIRNGTSEYSALPAVGVGTPGGNEPIDGGRPGLDRPLRALYLGTMGRSQSLDAVIRAAALVAARGYRLEVRMVGRGSEVDRLRRLAAEIGAPVSIEDAIPHMDALSMYRRADTAVVALHGWAPFEWTIPSKVYEVMARGVPVTAALSGEAASLVRELGAGVVVRPDDAQAIADLWSGWCTAGAVPPAAPEAGDWVRRVATWDVLARHYGEVLDRLVAPDDGQRA